MQKVINHHLNFYIGNSIFQNMAENYTFTGHYQQDASNHSVSGELRISDKNRITGKITDAQDNSLRDMVGKRSIVKGRVVLDLLIEVKNDDLLNINYKLIGERPKSAIPDVEGEYQGTWLPRAKNLGFRVTGWYESHLNNKTIYNRQSEKLVPKKKDMIPSKVAIRLQRKE